MTNEQRMKNLTPPAKMVDVVLDTDAFNEIDDQYAIAYLLRSKDRLNTRAIYAAPFLNMNSQSAKDGMEKSYDEILKVIKLCGESVDVFKGSDNFLTDEKTPVISPAAQDLANRVNDYSPENPLYVVAIGAITNVASAMLLNPKMAENAVVVWLGGQAMHYSDTKEFNLYQDVAAARVVMGSGVPFVHLPCAGVVNSFRISQPELEAWFIGKGELATYLAKNTIELAKKFYKYKTWRRVIWDITPVAWLLNDNQRFMRTRKIPTPLPSYEFMWEEKEGAELMEYAYSINPDVLWADVVEKLTE